MLLPIRQLPCLRFEIRQVALQRRAAKEVSASLEHLPQLALRLRQPAECIARALSIQLLKRLLELRQALADFRRQGMLKLFPDFIQPVQPVRVVEPGGLGALTKCVERVSQLFGYPAVRQLSCRPTASWSPITTVPEAPS